MYKHASIFFVIILISVLGFSGMHSDERKDPLSIKYMEAQYAADFSNDEVLVGASHNVFVGKVLEQSGTKERGMGPETQFKIQVVENVKGDLKGIVIVNQEGGYKDGVLYVMGSAEQGNDTKASDSSTYLLQPGSTYLFATRHNKKENWYTLNSYPTALKLISKESLDVENIKNLALNDSRVNELKEAYKNEKLLEADVKNNNALNNYKSIQEKLITKEKEETPSEEKQDENTKIEEEGSTSIINETIDDVPASENSQDSNDPEGAEEPVSPPQDQF